MKSIRYMGVFLGAMCCAMPSWAWVKDYQTRYVLGDNDSRLSAKQNALSQLQLQAMQEAGTYIQGQTQLLNEQLEERISQINAAIVKLDVLSEQFELTAQGQQVLKLTVRANVDESILQERVRASQFEANKARTLDKLTQDNQQMSQQLQQMTQQKLALENQLLRQQLSQLEKSQVGAMPTDKVEDFEKEAPNQKDMYAYKPMAVMGTSMSQSKPTLKDSPLHQKLNQSELSSSAENMATSATNNAEQAVPNQQAVAVKKDVLRFDTIVFQENDMPRTTETTQEQIKSEALFLKALTQRLQKTLVMVHVNSDEGSLKIQPDWKLSLAPQSPISDLCQRWRCVLGYAYKASFNDALASPLHLKLFRPFSRVVHIDDKYISHWQLLTLQAYPPSNITPQDAELIEKYRLMAQVNINRKQIEVPLIQYDNAQGALVVALQGAVNTTQMTTYNYQTKEGNLMCALASSTTSCAKTDLIQFTWHRIDMPPDKAMKIKTQIVQL